jgi:thioredoxin-like negative regulator of GroEL
MEILKIHREAFQHEADNGRFLIIVWSSRGADTTPMLDYAALINAQFPEAYLAQIVIDEEPELAASFGINESPVLMIMREQVILYLEPALPEPEIFEGLLRRAGSLDMTKVHAEIQQQKEAEMAMFSRRVCPTAKRSA